MRITYDAEADALDIYLQGKPGQAVDRTQELGNGIAGFARGCPEVSLEQLVYKGVRQ